jgi:hypothetical protein
MVGKFVYIRLPGGVASGIVREISLDRKSVTLENPGLFAQRKFDEVKEIFEWKHSFFPSYREINNAIGREQGGQLLDSTERTKVIMTTVLEKYANPTIYF